MKLPTNGFRQAMQGDEVTYGLWLGLPDASVAEIAAGAGFDWLLIDHEHSPLEVSDVLKLLRAVAPYPVAPIVRPVNDDPALLKKLLDIGVLTFLVPMVDSAAQAEAVVKALRYPPAGRRGVGAALARAARWGQVPGYLQQANDEICLIVQVETVAALENLEAIVNVAGVDGVFIGPSDLSASMGHLGDPGHAAVTTAIHDALGAIARAGKYAGVLCTDPDMAPGYIGRGARFLGVGTDTLVLARGSRKLLASYREPGPTGSPGSSGGR